MKSYILPAIATALLVGTVNAANTTVTTFDGLMNALIQAGDGATITLASGTYNASSQIDVTANNVTLVSASGKANTIIDGGSQQRILYVSGTGFKVEGITFANAYYAGNGGAISYSSSGVSQTTFVKDCDFIDCTAKYGGAIYAGQNSYTSFEPRANYGIVSGCTFLRCGVATVGNEGGGGAIFGALWVEDSVFDACFCSDMSRNQYHAAIDVTRYATVSNCVFRNHSQTKRGLIGASEIYQETKESGCARLVDCIIANNTAAAQDDVLFHRKVILDRCVISNNASTVTWNKVGLYRLDGDNGFSKVTSCLFIDNQYPFNMDNNLPPLLNCTFVRNVGGLACDSAQSPRLPAVTNCVFWGNVAKTDWPFDAVYKGVPGLYWHPSTQLAGQIQLANVVVENGAANSDVSAVLATDASGASTRLTALAAQKGPGFKDMANGDFSLKRASVLVDAGVKADWMDSACDIAGNKRCLKRGLVSDDALPDIGCYEFYAVAGFKISFR